LLFEKKKKKKPTSRKTTSTLMSSSTTTTWPYFAKKNFNGPIFTKLNLKRPLNTKKPNKTIDSFFKDGRREVVDKDEKLDRFYFFTYFEVLY